MMEPPSFNSGKSLLDCEQRTLHVDVEHLVEMLLCNVTQGGKLTEAGISEDNVDSSPLFINGFVKTIKISQLGDVPLNTSNITSNGSHRLVQQLLRRPVMKT